MSLNCEHLRPIGVVLFIYTPLSLTGYTPFIMLYRRHDNYLFLVNLCILPEEQNITSNGCISNVSRCINQ